MSQAIGPKVWCDLVYDTAIAKTAGAGNSNAVNANASGVKIQKKAIDILGFLIGYNILVTTDTELVPQLMIKVTNKTLGITNEIIVIPRGTMDGDANTPYGPMETVFVPWKIPEGKEDKLFNSTFEFSAFPSSTNTGGLDIVCAVVHTDTKFAPNDPFVMELLSQQHGRIGGGDAQADPAKAHAAGATAVDLTALALTAGTKQIRALLSTIQPNGITAGDPIGGWMEFSSSGIDDFSPQRWPLSVFWNAALGTVAEGALQSGRGRYYPTRFPLTEAEVAIAVTSTLIIAAAAAPDTCQGCLYDR